MSTTPVSRNALPEVRSPWKAFALAAAIAFVFTLLGATVGHAQDSTVVVPDAPTSPLGALAYAVLLPVVAWIASKLYDGIKTIIPPFDRLPATVHMIAAPIFTFLFGAVASATGAALLTDIHQIDAAWIGGILNLLLAAGIKRWEKSKHPTDATVVLENTRASSADRIA